MKELGATYTIRYGWTRSGAWTALIFAFLIGGDFAPGAEPPPHNHLMLVLAPFLAVIVLMASSRRIAVVIDPKGITLGGLPAARRAEFAAWSDIVSVSLYTEEKWRLKFSELEVRSKKGTAVPSLASTSSPVTREIDEYLATSVDADFVETFRGTTASARSMFLCRMDPARLKETVQGFAPEVRVFGDFDDFDDVD
ncbi:hypothetical protein AB0I77_03065 [Streptomyces sp. NPDC050619]|uniref:hypothetical protein n=1 Tax=Streptomyces sp. NPDC050619 TaxID=3157214 RepID=UPI00343435EA